MFCHALLTIFPFLTLSQLKPYLGLENRNITQAQIQSHNPTLLDPKTWLNYSTLPYSIGP